MTLEHAQHIREQVLTQLVEYAKKQLPNNQTKLFTNFVSCFYANLTLEDLTARTIPNLGEIALSQWNFLYQRAPHEIKIQVFNPPYTSEQNRLAHTVIQMANDDMPFLVDSTRVEVNRQGFRIHFMFHEGEIYIKRDAQGQIIAVSDKEHAEPSQHAEAVIHIEIERQTEPEVLQALQTGLKQVLADVQVAVVDWSKMRERLHEALIELDANPPPFDATDIAESKEFLRWLDNDHFTYLGCRDYEVTGVGTDSALQIVSGSGLGVLREESKSKKLRLFSSLPPVARELALAPQVLVISKTNTKATVHRPVYTDYIGIKRYSTEGKLSGERRFIGLYTSTAYNSHPKDIPLLRRKVAMVMENSKLSAKGHSGKELLDILATLPRDDLFQASTEELTQLTLGILHIQERQQLRLFVRQDAYRRFISCLVYVPREQFDTELWQTIRDILLETFHGLEISYSPLFSESELARVHYLIRTEPQLELAYNVKQIESKLIEATRSWTEKLRDALIEYYGEEQGARLIRKYAKAFPASYRDNFLARHAIYDIEQIERLSPRHALELNFYRGKNQLNNWLHFKLFQANNPIILSDVLPMLENMGLRVVDEQPYEIVYPNGKRIWIHDFGVIPSIQEEFTLEAIKEIFQEAFTRVWFGDAENDGFNRLVLNAQLTWREAALLRAYAKYLRQTGFTFSQSYIETTLAKNALIAKLLVELFKYWFDPTKQDVASTVIPEMDKQLSKSLDSVANLDEDRILRRFAEAIRATLRTNYFQKDTNDQVKPWIAFKLNPNRIADLPLPRPLYEIFVYSPRMEAIHLRAAKVARGGIRWSDRREDFRTEVLSLMKAQQVKNAVIVPAGAKGGFVIKSLAADASRETVMEEVITCYKTFMRGLLDLTDNLQAGQIIPPADTVRYDDDDPYLVVAADKGTATFSDIANEIAQEYNFWLGDAFASGGSVGYDHKKIGITARGAWESVKRHFATLGMDPAHQAFTVVGIGDMSGDVFGNGMLRSQHVKLVAAFNHMHIFLDPDPDPEQSFQERQRLFNLPRSGWEDYDIKILSEGGGIYKRSAKTIALSPQIQNVLGIQQDNIDPNALIKAILTAPVDLLWNGGIGTYVKASYERHSDVGDRTNDNVRVNADQLRCRAVGEGGNLGFTQLARVEYALGDGLIYTDFIDNSAGVDCSDHEVNCKILLNSLVTNGMLTLEQRNQLLAEMTDEVAELVVNDNRHQTRAINLAISQAVNDFELNRTYLEILEHQGLLDRNLEFLPDDKLLSERKALNKGLTSPEIAILLAYSKIIIKNELLNSTMLEDPYLVKALASAFPAPLHQRFNEQLQQHSLRREIIATQLSNAVVNDMGITFVWRMQNETNQTTLAVVQAYQIAYQIFNMRELIQRVDNLSTPIVTSIRFKMMTQITRLVRRAARWFLRSKKDHLLDLDSTIQHFRRFLTELDSALPELLSGNEREAWQATVNYYSENAVPAPLAMQMAKTNAQFALLDIIHAATENNFSLKDVAQVYFTLGDRLELAWLRDMITHYDVKNQWTAASRAALRDDLDAQQRKLSIVILQSQQNGHAVTEHMHHWLDKQRAFLQRWQNVVTELRSLANPDLIILSIAVRELIELVREARAQIRRHRQAAKKIASQNGT